MKNKFLLGTIVGASTLIVAVPLFAQLSNAASSGSSTIPSQTAPTQQVSSADTKDVAPDKEVPDAQEAAVDQSQAKISADVAAQTATQAQPGTVHENKLDNEHGNLAYKVEITNAGKEYDVLVDAVTGKVIKNWEDGQGGSRDGQEGKDANEVKDANEKGDANEANDKNGQGDQNEQEDGAPSSVGAQAPSAPSSVQQ